MKINKINYDNNGTARASILGDAGKEYITCLNREDDHVWCSCNYFTFNPDKLCKHILTLLENVEVFKMKKKENLDRVKSGCNAIDDLLGGGVPYGVVTGTFGKPMSGKSQFCYQMAIANLVESNEKTLYIDTEGMRVIDIKGMLYKLGKRYNISKEDIDNRVILKTTIGDIQLKSIQKLMQMFGTMVTFTQSAGGKITPIFQSCTPTIKEEVLGKEFSMIIVDSLSKPVKDGITSTTSNLPTRSQVQERFLGMMNHIATKDNMAVIVNSHVSSNPVMPFGTDFGKPVGGASIMYNTKYTLEFWDATNKIKKESGFDLEARRVRLYRHPVEQIDGVWKIVRLRKDYGYCDE